MEPPPAPAASCPACGGGLGADGRCRPCLFGLALEDAEADNTQAEASGYEIVRVIGRGGMGTVYHARQVAAGREVALKMVQAQFLQDRVVRERFRSEVRLVASLSHPHVLPLYDVGERDGLPFFTMQLAPGGSLAERLARDACPPRQAAEWLAKVARAVQHAHERGVLHRDLKPANILLGAQSEPYVGDFGVARALSGPEAQGGLTQIGAVVGSPNYMAPEQASGAAVTTAADIYGLGAILYECLTGRAPFAAPTPVETLRLAAETPPPAPRKLRPEVPRDLEVIALKCLAKDPAARYRSAGELADDLEFWLAGRPIRARVATLWERTSSWSRRNPALAALTAALLLLLGAGAVGIVLANARLARSRDAAIQAEKSANDRLGALYLAQARSARQAGRRTEALQALEQARRWGAAKADLRDEMASTLGLHSFAPGPAIQPLHDPAATYAETDGRLRLLVEAGSDQRIRVYSMADSSLLQTLPLLPVVETIYPPSPDLRYIAFKTTGGETHVYQREPLREVVRLIGPKARGHHAIAFSADGSLLAAGRADRGVALFRLPPEGGAVPLLEISVEESSGLAFSPDGSRVVTVFEGAGFRGSQDGFLRVYRTADGTVDWSRPRPRGFLTVAWSPDGTFIAAPGWDRNIVLYDARDGRELGLLAGYEPSERLRFSPSGRRLLATMAAETDVWDVRARQRLAGPSGHWAQFEPDERRLLVMSEGRKFRYYVSSRAKSCDRSPAQPRPPASFPSPPAPTAGGWFPPA